MTLLDRVGGIIRGETHHHAQLGLTDRDGAIKELVDCLVLPGKKISEIPVNNPRV